MRTLLNVTLAGVVMALGGVALGAKAQAEVSATASGATATVSSPLVGSWPKTTPKISLSLEDVEVGDALKQIAEQAGWDLALSVPDSLAEREITLRLTNRPAAEALEIVLKAGGLQAQLENKVLVVKPAPGAGLDIDIRVKADELSQKAEELSEKAEEEAEKAQAQIEEQLGKHLGKRHGRRTDRVSMGKPLRIEPGEVVADAVAIGAPLSVAGVVRGDAVAIGGPLKLEAGAVVNGDAVAVGGPLDVDPGAVVRGDQVSVGGGLGGSLAKLIVHSVTGEKTGLNLTLSPLFSTAGAFLRGVVLFVLALLVLAFMPERLERMRTFLTTRPGASLLAGLGLLVGFLPLCLLLLVTIVGIPLVPVVLLLLFACLVVGLTAVAVWLGYKIPLFKTRKSAIGAMAIGVLLIVLVDFVPILGTVVVVTLGFVGAGAVLLSRFGTAAAEGAPETPGGPASTAGQPGAK